MLSESTHPSIDCTSGIEQSPAATRDLVIEVLDASTLRLSNSSISRLREVSDNHLQSAGKAQRRSMLRSLQASRIGENRSRKQKRRQQKAALPLRQDSSIQDSRPYQVSWHSRQHLGSRRAAKHRHLVADEGQRLQQTPATADKEEVYRAALSDGIILPPLAASSWRRMKKGHLSSCSCDLPR